MKLDQLTQDQLDMEELMGREAFHRFLLRCFESFHILATTHVANAQTQSAFAEGRRAAGLEILGWATSVRPNALILALAQDKPPAPPEQHNGRRRDESRFRSDDRGDE